MTSQVTQATVIHVARLPKKIRTTHERCNRQLKQAISTKMRQTSVPNMEAKRMLHRSA